MRCCNSGCTKNADNPNRILMNTDGDFACSQTCKIEYEKKRDHFLDDILHSPEKTEAWLLGEID